MQQNYTKYQNVRHFASLDGLRFLCILPVLWHHGTIWPALTEAPQLVARGFLGVAFFFVLSGYLITTLLLREEATKGHFSLRGFYWRRCLRILPVYFLLVTVLALYFIGIKGETQYLELLPFYYLFLSNFLTEHIPFLGPTWSLSVEEQYYIIWPLLLLLTPRRFILPLLGIVILLNVVAVLGYLDIFGIRGFDLGPLRIEMFSTTYTPILIGSGLAILLHSPTGFAALYRLCGATVSPLIWFAALLWMMNAFPKILMGWPNLMIHLTMALCLASIVIREDNILRPILTLRPVVRIGQISYGIYLYHLVCLYISIQIFAVLGITSDWLLLIAYSALSIALSEVSFRYYEQPFLRLRHRSGRTNPVKDGTAKEGNS